MTKLFYSFFLWMICSFMGISNANAQPSLSIDSPSLGECINSRNVYVYGYDLTSDIQYSITGPDAVAFSVSPESGWNARRGGALRTIFNPTHGPGLYYASLTISSPGAESRTISLGRSKLGQSTDRLNFQDVEINTSVSQTVDVWGFDLSDDDLIRIAPYNEASTSSFTVSVLSYDAVTMKSQLSVTFTPTEVNEDYRATLTIGNYLCAPIIDLYGSSILPEGTPLLEYMTPPPEMVSDGPIPEFRMESYNIGVNETNYLVPHHNFISVRGVNLTGNIEYKLDGADASAFTIRKLSWDPSTGGYFYVDFNPTEEREYNANLVISSPEAWSKFSYGSNRIAWQGPMIIHLTSRGVSPTITVNPINPSFEATVNTNSSIQPISVSSVSPFYSLESECHVEGADASAFTYTVVHSPGDTNGILNMTFNPTEERNYNATLIICNRDVTKIIPLVGTGIALDPVSLTVDAPALSPCANSRTVSVVGSGLTSDIQYSISGSDAAAFSLENPAPGWDARTGGSFRILFNPIPGGEGVYDDATLTVSSGTESRTVSIGAVNISASTNEVKFMDASVNTTSSKTIDVVGIDLRHADNIKIEGSPENISNFAINVVSYNEASMRGTLSVAFTPTEVKSDYSATLTLGNSPCSVIIPIAGAGVAINEIIIVDDQETVSFNNIDINNTATQTIEISGNLSDISYQLSGVNASAFEVTERTGLRSSNHALEIKFTPTQNIVYVASLTISSPGAKPKVISLVGEGKVSTATAIENVKTGGVTVYPNPVVDKLIVETSEQNIGKMIEIYTINGNLVNGTKIEGARTTINTSSLAKGMYIIRINGQSIKVVKI